MSALPPSSPRSNDAPSFRASLLLRQPRSEKFVRYMLGAQGGGTHGHYDPRLPGDLRGAGAIHPQPALISSQGTKPDLMPWRIRSIRFEGCGRDLMRAVPFPAALKCPTELIIRTPDIGVSISSTFESPPERQATNLSFHAKYRRVCVWSSAHDRRINYWRHSKRHGRKVRA